MTKTGFATVLRFKFTDQAVEYTVRPFESQVYKDYEGVNYIGM